MPVGVMGGGGGAYRALCDRWAVLVPLPLLAKVTAATTVFPDTGLPQIPTQSKNSDNELKQTMFHTENAKMLPVFGLNLLCLARGRMLP